MKKTKYKKNPVMVKYMFDDPLGYQGKREDQVESSAMVFAIAAGVGGALILALLINYL